MAPLDFVEDLPTRRHGTSMVGKSCKDWESIESFAQASLGHESTRSKARGGFC